MVSEMSLLPSIHLLTTRLYSKAKNVIFLNAAASRQSWESESGNVHLNHSSGSDLK